MCKINRSQLKALREFSEKADKYGALPVDEWTSGKGRFTKPRALPPFCKRFEREAFDLANACAAPKHSTPARSAYEFFRANARRKAVYVLDRAAFEAWAWDSLAGAELPDTALAIRDRRR